MSAGSGERKTAQLKVQERKLKELERRYRAGRGRESSDLYITAEDESWIELMNCNCKEESRKEEKGKPESGGSLNFEGIRSEAHRQSPVNFKRGGMRAVELGGGLGGVRVASNYIGN